MTETNNIVPTNARRAAKKEHVPFGSVSLALQTGDGMADEEFDASGGTKAFGFGSWVDNSEGMRFAIGG